MFYKSFFCIILLVNLNKNEIFASPIEVTKSDLSDLPNQALSGDNSFSGLNETQTSTGVRKKRCLDDLLALFFPNYYDEDEEDENTDKKCEGCCDCPDKENKKQENSSSKNPGQTVAPETSKKQENSSTKNPGQTVAPEASKTDSNKSPDTTKASDETEDKNAVKNENAVAEATATEHASDADEKKEGASEA